MPSISWPIIGTFSISLLFQVAALLMLPSTRGFTNAMASLLCVGLFAVALWMLARITSMGVDLSLLIPISAASVPLATSIAAILIYREPGSPLRIIILLAACGLVGVASRIR